MNLAKQMLWASNEILRRMTELRITIIEEGVECGTLAEHIVVRGRIGKSTLSPETDADFVVRLGSAAPGCFPSAKPVFNLIQPFPSNADS